MTNMRKRFVNPKSERAILFYLFFNVLQASMLLLEPHFWSQPQLEALAFTLYRHGLFIHKYCLHEYYRCRGCL